MSRQIHKYNRKERNVLFSVRELGLARLQMHYYSLAQVQTSTFMLYYL